MKLRLKIEAQDGNLDNRAESGVFDADARALVEVPELIGGHPDEGPVRQVLHHMAGIPPEWIRDFLRSI